jgi:DNA-binding transcriptional LysR family regulator
LFSRNHRRVELTPAGRVFLDDARDILARSTRAAQRVQDETAGRAGSLFMAHTDGALSERITKQLRKFLRRSRGLRLELQRVSYGQPLERGTWDGLLTEFSTTDLPSEALILEQAAVQVAVPPKHRLMERPGFVPADLIGETLLVSPPESRSPSEKSLLSMLEAQNIACLLEVSSEALQHRFWQASLGLGLCVCASSDRGALDSHRIALLDSPLEIVTTLLPHPRSRAAALPLLAEALRA